MSTKPTSSAAAKASSKTTSKAASKTTTKTTSKSTTKTTSNTSSKTGRAEGEKRPAHRPSRREHIIASALSLFVRSPYDDVKVADIAALADLTPAAVHYHFDGKEQILLEAMRKFSEGLLARAEELVDAKVDIATLMGGILTLLRSRRTAATVFFVSSAGLSLSFEAHRKLVRADMAELMIRAGKNDGKRRSKAESAVIGAALVSVLEVSATSMLRGDEGASTLGSRKLIETVGALASRVLG